MVDVDDMWDDEEDNRLIKQAAKIWDMREENGNLQAKCETIYDELLEARRQIEKLRAALQPFADVADNDICDSLTDDDIFRPITPEYSRAAVLCVGDLRAAAAALKEAGDDT